MVISAAISADTISMALVIEQLAMRYGGTGIGAVWQGKTGDPPQLRLLVSD
jgi:hypothetical protein